MAVNAVQRHICSVRDACPALLSLRSLFLLAALADASGACATHPQTVPRVIGLHARAGAVVPHP